MNQRWTIALVALTGVVLAGCLSGTAADGLPDAGGAAPGVEGTTPETAPIEKAVDPETQRSEELALLGWESRFIDLVLFVEQARALRFDHAVPIELLDDAAFLTDEDVLSFVGSGAAFESEVEQILRALGLGAPPGTASNAEAAWQIGFLGLYTSVEERIVVRGVEPSVPVRVTLVHELTHALHDQHFALSYPAYDVHAESALITLTEGDAESVAFEYLRSLADPAQAEYASWAAKTTDALSQAAGESFFTTLFAAPYVLGLPFVKALIATEGLDGLMAAFRSPPTTGEQILAPERFLQGEGGGYPSLPRLRRDEVVVSRGTLGPVAVLGLLAARIEFAQAMDAVLGWDGDVYALFDSDGRRCVQIGVSADSESDLDELVAAFAAWGAAVPGAESWERAGLAMLRSCDSGEYVPAVGSPELLLEMLSARGVFLVGAARENQDLAVATCVTDTTIRLIGPEAFLVMVQAEAPEKDTTGAGQSRAEAVRRAVAQACGL